MNMTQQLDQAFAALSDPTRRAILARLARGEATVNQLVEGFSLTQPTISTHLKVLERAGLIDRRRVAQTRPCRLRPEGMKVVGEWVEFYRRFWEGSFDRMDTYLTELTKGEPDGPRN
jgi:DNA-binding transcriptional ArsR family regulator